MALNQIQTGVQNNPDGVTIQARAGKQGDTSVSELHGRYYEQTYRGNTYSLSLVTPAAATAYSGAAAGTPILALYNPIYSSKNAVILTASYANAVAASAAGTAMFGLYFGKTASITATANGTNVQMGTMATTGSQMTTFTNTALTGATAATGIIPIGSYYWATAAGAVELVGGPFDIAGQLIIPPGSYVGLGASSALTSATWTAAMVWEEVPV